MTKDLKKLLLATFFLSHSAFLSAQRDTTQGFEFSKNSIYVEVFGNMVGAISLNYERNLSIGEGLYSIRGGVGKEGFPPFRSGLFLSLKRWIGKKDHHFEFGIGQTALFDRAERGGEIDQSFIVFPLGYRYHPKDGGFVFRVTYNPFLIYTYGDEGVILHPVMAGISLGKSF